jgi:hypothetical protein
MSKAGKWVQLLVAQLKFDLALKRKSKIRVCEKLAERKIPTLYRSFAITAFFI